MSKAANVRARIYVLSLTNGTRCPGCHNLITMLAPNGMSPRAPGFYICWPCHRVWRIGREEVKALV